MDIDQQSQKYSYMVFCDIPIDFWELKESRNFTGIFNREKLGLNFSWGRFSRKVVRCGTCIDHNLFFVEGDSFVQPSLICDLVSCIILVQGLVFIDVYRLFDSNSKYMKLKNDS